MVTQHTSATSPRHFLDLIPFDSTHWDLAQKLHEEKVELEKKARAKLRRAEKAEREALRHDSREAATRGRSVSATQDGEKSEGPEAQNEAEEPEG